jgi:ketosteroid isomerase-like protein
MADHPNATLVRRLYETFDRKDVPTISALLSKDAL